MGVIEKIRYNCRQATLLIEKKQLTKLSIPERISLRIHLTGCSVCRLYEVQSRLINNMIDNIFKNPDISDTRLDDDFKKDLQERIEEELNKN
jgi:hypothetical protein